MRSIERSSIVALCAAALLASGCRKGSAKGARLASERLAPHVAQLENVAKSAVTVQMDEEIFRNVWFGRASAAGRREWRCFVDVDRIFCDHGEGKIFAELVAHRRLGDNRGSIDDPAWVQLIRHGFALQAVFPDTGFPVAPGLDPKRDLRVPRVERPKDGGVFVTLYAIDAEGRTLRFEADVTGEGTTAVRRTALP